MNRDSLAWLGEYPSRWNMVKLRRILMPFSEKNHLDMPLLSVVREKGVIVRNVEDKEENHNYIPHDLSNYKLVKCGQFVMNKMKAWQGSYGISKYDGIVSARPISREGKRASTKASYCFLVFRGVSSR